MNQGKIIVRMSRSSGIYNKLNKYEILLNNQTKAELDYVNSRQIFNVESGKNSVVFKNENTTIVEEINIKYAQEIIVTINASITYKLGLGIMLGISVIGLEELQLLSLLHCIYKK